MNDLELLQSHDPAAGPMPLGAQDALLASLRLAPTRLRRRRLVTLSLAGAAVAATSGGLAYAVLSGQPPTTALKINCSAGITETEFSKEKSFTSVMDVLSGDPVADCASEYQRLGLPLPTLQAYSSGSVFVWVVPASWQVPTTWAALETSFRSDTTRLALKQGIEDPVDGPGVGCPTTKAVHDAVVQELSTEGLADWSVAPVPGSSPADGDTSCAFAFLDEGADKHVYLQSGPADGSRSAEQGPYEQLIRRLRTDVAQRCLTIEDAQAATQQALDDTGLKAEISSGTPTAERCTRIDLIRGGLLNIRLS